MKPKYFLFDIGNVLVNFDFQVLFDRISTDSGRPVEEPTARDQEMYHAVESGVISDQEFVDYMNEAKGLSWTLDDLIGVWQGMFSINDAGRALFCDAIEHGVPVYTLSNIAGHHIEAIERNWPVFFDGATRLFLSYQIGMRKPGAEIYSHLLEELDMRGEHCFFIDDLPENVAAARAAGIQAHQFVPENYAAISQAARELFRIF